MALSLSPPTAPPLSPPTAPPVAPPPVAPPPAPEPTDPPPLSALWRVAAASVVAGLVLGAGGSYALRRTTASGSQAAAPAAASTTSSVTSVDAAVVDITTTVDGGQAAGTGMVLTSAGLVLTNNHVISGATSISVQIGGTGTSYRAHVVGYDVSDDVAVIQLEDVSKLKTITTSTAVPAVGTSIVAIGNALGAPGPHAVVTGTVVATGQTITAGEEYGNTETLNDLIQTDAPLQPGDSGGPLVDTSGHVIGMNTAASTGSRFNPTTQGYAIPIGTALSIAKQIEQGKSSATVHIGDRAILGVQVASAGASGATIVGVQSGTPAAKAGISTGDVITEIDGTLVTSAASLEQALAGRSVGDSVKVTWTDSDGTSHTASIKLVAGPPA